MDAAANAQKIVEALKETEAESEANRVLSARAVELLHQAGLTRIVSPAAYGGYQLPVRALVEAERVVAHGSTAASWVLMVCAAHTFIAGRLPRRGQDEIFGADPGMLIPGVPSLRGTCQRTTGGYILNGRWPYASGADHGDWVLVGCRGIRNEAGEPCPAADRRDAQEGRRHRRHLVHPRHARHRLQGRRARQRVHSRALRGADESRRSSAPCRASTSRSTGCPSDRRWRRCCWAPSSGWPSGACSSSSTRPGRAATSTPGAMKVRQPRRAAPRRRGERRDRLRLGADAAELRSAGAGDAPRSADADRDAGAGPLERRLRHRALPARLQPAVRRGRRRRGARQPRHADLLPRHEHRDPPRDARLRHERRDPGQEPARAWN